MRRTLALALRLVPACAALFALFLLRRAGAGAPSGGAVGVLRGSMGGGVKDQLAEKQVLRLVLGRARPLIDPSPAPRSRAHCRPAQAQAQAAELLCRIAALPRKKEAALHALADHTLPRACEVVRGLQVCALRLPCNLFPCSRLAPAAFAFC